MEAFVNEVIMAYGNWRFLMLTVILLVVGLIFLKGYKKRFVVPMIILAAVILNPLFYTLWYKFNDRSYWRMLWMVPIIPVGVVVPAFFIEKSKKNITKIVALVFASALMIISGSFIYDGSRNVFAAANNPEKLPDDVVAVGEALLEVDVEPYVVTDSSLSVYLRQYSGKIKSVYGRDFKFQTSNPDLANKIFENLSSPECDFDAIAQEMLNYDYKYLVTRNADEVRKQRIIDAGFEEITSIHGYGIYRVTGERTEIREYNDLHQVVSVTSYNENGQICENYDGYARVEYRYLEDGKDPIAYFYDPEGQQLEMGSGYFHDFLINVLKNEVVLFMSVKDEATRGMIEIIIDDMKALGIKTDLTDKYRQSFYAVIAYDFLIEELSQEALVKKGEIDGIAFEIMSAGKTVGDCSSIILNGVEYSNNGRGLNIVVYDRKKGKVVDSFSIDTFLWLMKVSR